MKIQVKTLKVVPASVIFRECDTAWDELVDHLDNNYEAGGISDTFANVLDSPKEILEVLHDFEECYEDDRGPLNHDSDSETLAEVKKVMKRLEKMPTDILVDLLH